MATAVKDAPKTAPPAEAKAAGPKTGHALLAYLKDTGTGADKLAVAEAFLHDRKAATAADLLAHLQRSQVSRGTLAKAGRWLHGDHWEPDAAEPITETEAMARLKHENGRLRGQIRDLEGDKLRLLAEAQFARSQVADSVKAETTARVTQSESLITPRDD